MADGAQSGNQDRQTGAVRIGDVIGGIHDSIIAGGDVIQNIFLGGKKESRDRQNQIILLRRVRDFWIQGVLERSVHRAALIELGKEELAEAVERPWDVVLQGPDRPSGPLPPGKPLVELFEEMGGSLLILGEPGSGKTITLLELARDAIARAEADPAQPIPVVFHLSSWAERRRPLPEWLVEELNAKYRIPRRIGRSWVEQDVLLLLLDGLDEVDTDHRQACVEAINEYCQDHGLGGIVVCSRTAEYDALGTKLNLGSAILIQPLTPKQVNEYLVAAGPRFDALRMAMQQDASLQELAQTPLMLSVMTLTYRDISAEALIPAQPDAPQASRHNLFAAYVDRMFTRLVRATRESYTREQSVTWLAWLARRMGDHSQSVFLIEGLQPSWLGTQAQRRLYAVGSRAIQGLLIGLVMVPLLFGLMQFYGLPSAGILIVCYLAAGIGVGLVDGLRFARGSPG